jgi:membrane protein insertase Oxa1/YidC/SpoIIIJ
MAEKMPSFKHGGAFWFTDLSTPDALYIFPVLTALSFLIVVEVSTSFSEKPFFFNYFFSLAL